MIDERLTAKRILGDLEVSNVVPLLLFVGAFLLAALLAWGPEYEGLSSAGRRGIFILLFASFLWLTEAIPAFAVGIVVLGLSILLLNDVAPMQVFLVPWSSPIIWLFFGGFVMAAAASRSGLDRWLSAIVLRQTGNRPPMLLLGVMGSTFVFSMFMSNTATASMMLTVLLPILAGLASDNPMRRSLPLGVAFAANIGGMGTIIGSPPNAILAGLMYQSQPIGFLMWSAVALPVAIPLAGIVWVFLVWYYPSQDSVNIGPIELTGHPKLPLWQRMTTIAVFAMTISLWISTPLHGMPIAAVSFLPIMVLTITRVIRSEDIRGLPWDVLLLITGGLCLAEVVDRTGLTEYLVEQLPIADLGPIALALGLAWICTIVSNFMSNTAASNILLPLALALTGGRVELVMPIALAASAAMCLPVSTPPNALAASRTNLTVIDFLPVGLMIGFLTAPLALLMCLLVF